MKIQGRPYHTLWELPDASGIEVIDQRALPHELRTVALRTADEVAVAIREMVVRGAPLIGAVAAYGMYLAAHTAAGEDAGAALARAAGPLAATRPTAVNLRWAIHFVLDRARRGATSAEVRELALAAARSVVADELERSRRIGEAGVRLIEEIAGRKRGEPVRVLTHCNAGWLATVDYGTATAPIYAAHDRGVQLHVWVDETRPRNQGAALTAFELGEHGVPHAVVVDNAGGHLMQQGAVDLVLVGADRIAANGDTANKIGTYLKALAAHDNGVPFYVAAPSSSVDLSISDGSRIPIEERDPEEVRSVEGAAAHGVARVRIVPETTPACNPAFDVTPVRLITGFVTERGIVAPGALASLAAG